MDHDADPGVNRGTVDLTKLTNEELIETVKELIEENIALKDKLRIVERTLALKNGAGQDAAAFHDNQDVTTTDFEVMTNRDGNGSDDSGEHEHEHEHESDKTHEKDEVEEVDSEAYFKKMTEIIRDMAKSPSVILNYHEVDNFMSSKKGHKEKADIKMWERDIIPFLKDKEHREKTKLKIKSVIYSFIPTKHRAKVWPMLIGNSLRIKREIYDHFCTLLETNPVDPRVSHIIREDLVRTYPNFKCFNRGEALNSELQCLLELFQFARPDIGYVQGMAYPATMLLLHMDRYHAFKCLMNMIVSNPFLKALFTFNLKESRRSFRAFDHYLKQKSPASYKHLMKMDVQSETFLIEWYYTLFCRSFAIQDAAKIWDVFLLEGEIVFLRVALRIFQAVESQLLKKDYAQTLSFIRSCTATIDIDTIFKQMQNSKMTVDRLERFYEKDKKKVRMSEEKPQTN